ncbi:MAG: hypothetical protein HUU01_05850 [Saprospiraceae bacterium]|nr:hypothetical protein [Saprospiraceae bacterium]
MNFKITGIVREKESKQPLKGLLIRAIDRDFFFHDLLGNAVTGADGDFVIGYEGEDFKDLVEQRPDIFFNIYSSATAANPGRDGDSPIFTTKEAVRFNSGTQEFFIIEIPREQLGDDATGSNGVVTTPETGEWKKLIDEYLKLHPINFQYNPEKGFLAPRLVCDSNFGPDLGTIGEPGEVKVIVNNIGNGPSFFTYVAVYEGPSGYTHPLRDYRLSDYKIISINPGQTIDVKLKWTRLLTTGRIAGVCFDPFLDPRGFDTLYQRHPHITSVHYISLK